MKSAPLSRRKRRWFWLGLILVLAALVEVVAWVGCRVLTARGIFYQPRPEADFFGSEVSDEEAWGNRLAAKLDARVDNFGVGGYGTDLAAAQKLRLSHRASPVLEIEAYARTLQKRPRLQPAGALS